MSERFCLLLLRRTAKRWPRGDEMLAEWRAELYTMDIVWDRLRYALSLAVSRPYRTSTLSVRRALPGIVTSFLLLLAVPVALVAIASRFWTVFGSDTVVMQSWTVAGCAAGAIVLGVYCARFTAGVSRVIRPLLLSSWVFGVPYLAYVTMAGLSGYWLTSAVQDMSAWVAGAIICGIVAVRLTLRGHTTVAWVFVALAAPVVTSLSALHMFGYLLDGSMGLPGWSAGWAVLSFATQPYLHVTLFGLVHTRSLAARHLPATS